MREEVDVQGGGSFCGGGGVVGVGRRRRRELGAGGAAVGAAEGRKAGDYSRWRDDIAVVV